MSRAWQRFLCTAALVTPLSAYAADAPVSFTKDVAPILTANCNGCHNEEKKKGSLDLSTFAATLRGTKDAKVLTPGHPEMSPLIEQVTGAEPAMPPKGEKLKPEQVAILTRWIKEGAKDDTPVAKPFLPIPAGKTGEQGPAPIGKPPTYHAAPVITALAYSPDGKLLAISGYHEVLLHAPEGNRLVGRLLSGTPRIETITFSVDGKYLATGGGAPAQFGHIQIWQMPEKKLVGSWKSSKDTVFGLNFTPDGQRIGFGCADKSARVISTTTGVELLRTDQHTDWCLGATFTVDGKRMLTGSRDKAMKLSDLADGRLIDDINNPLEPVFCMARHPKEDLIAYGGGNGTPRIYRMKDNQQRTAGRNDVNQVRAFERQPGPVHAIAYSPDGSEIAVGSVGEVRIYATADGKKLRTLGGFKGAIFAVAYSPDGTYVAAGGYDGMVRVHFANCGELANSFVPAPIEKAKVAAK